MVNKYFIVISDPENDRITASKFVNQFEEAKEFLENERFIGCDCSLYELTMIGKGYNGSDHKTA